MIVAVASGKGGTGKTTLAVNLAVAAALRNPPTTTVRLLDCDVEEPNAHLFLKPEFTEIREMRRRVPRVDEQRCEHCGRCADVCEFHAIAAMPNETLVFPELCHSCGACVRFCPHDAIEEEEHPLGTVACGTALDGRLPFGHGILDVGQPSAVPLIQALRGMQPAGGLTILDAPPGTTCPVVEAAQGSDLLLLVTEPTPFGLHDLRLAVEMAEEIRVPAAVVVNRSEGRDDEILEYAWSRGLPVPATIPFARRYAEILARGGVLALEDPGYRERMDDLLDAILGGVAGTAAAAAAPVGRAEAPGR